MSAVTAPRRQYVAEWVARWTQEMADAGQDPVFGKEGGFATLDEAYAFAVAMGRKAGQMEWVSITAKEFDRRTLTWRTVRRSTGDYDALEVQT